MHINEAAISLLRGIAAQGQIHLAELENDRGQVEQLLGSAFGRLGERCTRLCALIALDRSLADDVQAQITGTTGEIVTDLQVHDLASQVLQRSQQRIRGVAALLERLLQICAALDDPVGSTDAQAAQLADAGLSILGDSHALSAQLPRRVEQTSSDAGDITLF
jgi:hypothetical protein